MSAWMITDAHADFLATAYLQFVDATADPQQIGSELLTENARSLRARYQERHGMASEGEAQAAAYAFRPWRGNIDPENLHKQARCAQYQCCEHGEEWTASDSAKRVETLIALTGGQERRTSEHYPWGIDQHPEEERPANREQFEARPLIVVASIGPRGTQLRLF